MDEEYRQYRIDQAHEWLSKVRRIVECEKSMRVAADTQYELADGLRGLDYSRVQVTVSPTPDAIPDAVIAHEEAGDSLSAIADNARERIEQALNALSKMEDPVEANVLTMHYIEFRKWEQVCHETGYTMDGMAKLRKRALSNAYDIMPHEERDPQYKAL